MEVLQSLTVKTKPLQKVKMIVDLFGSKYSSEAEFSEESFESAAPMKSTAPIFYAIFNTVFAPSSYISDLC